MNRSCRLIVLGVSLAALASAGSCTTLTKYAVEGALEAITGEDVDLADSGEQGWNTGPSLQGARAAGTRATAAVYEVGPTPGWELGFREYTAVGSGYYQNRVCLNIQLQIDLGSLWSRRLPSPFASSDQLDYPLIVQENSLGIDPGYTRIGEVRLGGPRPPTGLTWQSAAMLGPYGSTGMGCPFLGIASFGQPSATGLILK